MVGSSGHKGISRIDSPKNKTHGWYVRVQFMGKTHAKFFSDSSNGGREKGLAKAVKHRNQIERDLGKPRTDRTVTAVSSRNRSGVQGVKKVTKGKGTAYEVTWSPAPGTVDRTTISVQKYGEEEAFRRACKVRQQKEKLFYGGVILKDIPTDVPDELSDEEVKAAKAAKKAEQAAQVKGKRGKKAAEAAA